MVPHGITGTIAKIEEGDYTVTDTVAELTPSDGGDPVSLTMLTKWEVRQGRPYKKKLPPNQQLVTGQRSVDMFFPIAKGGTACIPGPFEEGKQWSPGGTGPGRMNEALWRSSDWIR